MKRGLLLILALIVLAAAALLLMRDRKPGQAPNTIDMESRKKLERVIEEAEESEVEIDGESKARLEEVLEGAQTKDGSGEQP